MLENLLDRDHKIHSKVCTAVLQCNAYESTVLVHTAASYRPANHILQNLTEV